MKRYKVTACYHSTFTGLGWSFVGEYNTLVECETAIFKLKQVQDFSIFDNKEEMYID